MLTLQFTLFSTDIEGELKCAKSQKGVDWKVPLAHHLLQKLAVNQMYTIDKQNNGRTNQHICPCCDILITGRFVDTSIGRLCLYL